MLNIENQIAKTILKERKEPELIFVCSPLKAYGKYSFEYNIHLAQEYCREVAIEGNLPLAPHVYFTNFLEDNIPYERELGFQLGLKLLKLCKIMNVYIRNGFKSEGMKNEIELAGILGIKINEIYIQD